MQYFQKNSRVLIHIIGWAIFIASQEIGVELAGGWILEDYMLVLSKSFTRIVTFYFVYFLVWPKYLRMDKLPQLVSGIAIGLLIFPVVRFLIEEVIYLHIFGSGNYTDPVSWFYLNNNLWWYSLPTVSTSALVYLFEKSQQDSKEQLELQKEKTNAELAYLRSQINPHFLFNTFHFLHTEAFEKDPELADLILKVSNILRYSVESTKEGKRTVAKEMELINNYIDIFKKRYENRCFINFDYSGNGEEKLIEPLLLVPFVENAFKHGQFSDSNFPIEVSLNINDNQLIFHIRNKIKNQHKDPGHGIGIENVKRRLEVLYPRQHELHINSDTNNYEVILTLQL